MELSEVLRRRRMVREYDPDRPVSVESLETVTAAALRAPSAGFTQGVSLLVLDDPADRDGFWEATASPESASGSGPSRWMVGMQTAPVVVVVWTDKAAYLARYAEADKGWSDRDESRWSAPYWFVDAGMAAMAVLLAAVDEGLGACFFGVPPERVEDLRTRFAVPTDQIPVGALTLGHPASGRALTGSPTRRSRRDPAELIHHGRWTTPVRG